MTIRDFFKLLFITSLSLIFVIESVMAVLCFCGKCFPQSFPSSVELKINSNIYKSSADSNYKICNFEKRKSLKGIFFSKQSPAVKTYTTLLSCSFHDCVSLRQTQLDLRLLPHAGILRASPIFLKNLSIRC
jgi:hypothetical protein